MTNTSTVSKSANCSKSVSSTATAPSRFAISSSTVCRERGYVIEAAVVQRIRESLRQRGSINRGGFEEIVNETRPAIAGTTRNESDLRRLVLTTLDDSAARIRRGWFNDWYAKMKARSRRGIMLQPPNHPTTQLPRRAWTSLDDEALLAQCDVDTYRASGPGGQKRNKTSSAVRLRHVPTGLIVIAEESRSQHENKAKALKRMRRAFVLELRDREPSFDEWMIAKDAEGRVSLSAKDARFWPAAGVALDVLAECEAQVSTAAERLGVSTANLIDFLQTDPKLWQEANRLRTLNHQKPLRS